MPHALLLMALLNKNTFSKQLYSGNTIMDSKMAHMNTQNLAIQPGKTPIWGNPPREIYSSSKRNYMLAAKTQFGIKNTSK